MMGNRKNVFKIIKGKESPVFIVAEISANHGGRLDCAIDLIRKAKECGVDAVKFQTYTPDTITIDVQNRFFTVKHPEWGNQTLYELYKKAYTPWEWFQKLKEVADNEGILFFSTAFDKTAVDFLEDLNVPFHKIASFELVDLPLIEYAAKTKKPLILSTGVASYPEIKDAVEMARMSGARDIVLLKCVSSYPAHPKDMNLKTILQMKDDFNCIVGLSDHTMGVGVAVAATVLGARMIEKHFTLSRKTKSPDSFFSMDPGELKQLVTNIREAEQALGIVSYELVSSQKKMKHFERSLFVTRDIKKGELITSNNVKSVRPGNGLPPKYIFQIINKRVRSNIKKGTPLKKEHIEW
jgi:pseudaminic acid synthase